METYFLSSGFLIVCNFLCLALSYLIVIFPFCFLYFMVIVSFLFSLLLLLMAPVINLALLFLKSLNYNNHTIRNDIIIIIIYSFRVFHISVSWWFFTGI